MKIPFRFEILAFFVFIEVVLFGTNNQIQLAVSLIEYLFVFLVLLRNKETGIMYFISFTLLSFGQGNYESLELNPQNFYGIRLFGFSFNILFSLIIFIYLMLIKKKVYFAIDTANHGFFIYFVLYGLILGSICVMLSINHADNFLKDAMTYIPVLLYLNFLALLNNDALIKIVKHGITLSIIAFGLCYIFKKFFVYGQSQFFPSNTLYFILPFAIPLLRKWYSNIHFFSLLILLAGSMISGYYFISGKSIIVLFILLLWLGLLNLKIFVVSISFFVLLLLNIEPIFSTLSSFFGEDGDISAKFIQIQQAIAGFDLDWHTIATVPSSLGNLIAEALTIVKHLRDNIAFFIFGKGFGGGVPDLYGYLKPWAGASGYAYQDSLRNDYYRMHLAIYEVLLKSGLIGFLFYIYLLIKNFMAKNSMAFIYSILLFAVFYISKEMLLLSLIFMMLSKNKDDSIINKSDGSMIAMPSF